MKRVAVIYLLLLLCVVANAQKLTAHRNAVSDAYNFWLSVPNDINKCDTAKPLVVFLHGRSLCGHDLNRVLRYGPLNAMKYGLRIDAVVLAPQNPGSAWKPQKVMRLVDWTVRHYNVDTNRIYVIGMSLGGYGAIDFAGTYPDRVAAAMALCGGGTLKDYCGLNELPLWILHGTDDRAVGVGASQKVVDAMSRCGRGERLIWTKLAGCNHGRLARVFYLPDTYRWLFAHSLADTSRTVDRSFSITPQLLAGNIYRDLAKSEPVAVDYSRDVTIRRLEPQPDLEVTGADSLATDSTSQSQEINAGGGKAGASASKPQQKFHVVKKGETLSAIARKHHTTVKRLCQLNGIKSTTTLRVGRKLRVR